MNKAQKAIGFIWFLTTCVIVAFESVAERWIDGKPGGIAALCLMAIIVISLTAFVLLIIFRERKKGPKWDATEK